MRTTALCLCLALATSGLAFAQERPQRALADGDAAALHGRWKDETGLSVRFRDQGRFKQGKGLLSLIPTGPGKGTYAFGVSGTCGHSGNLSLSVGGAQCCYFASMLGVNPGNQKLILRAQPEPTDACPDRILRR